MTSIVPSSSITNDDLSWLSGGGEMGALIRSMDWSASPLGPPQAWPQSLRTTVSLCLSSTFPILVAWGPEHIQIYNDAYRPICGAKHPQSMGAPFKVCWATALPVVGDAFDRAQAGEGTYIRDQRMFLDRHGYLEEAFMTFSFSPIRAESGEVGGIFHPITETTAQVLSARRGQCLRDLTTALVGTRSLEGICSVLAEQQVRHALDLPFVMLYQREEGGAMLRRACAGIDPLGALAPAGVDADDLAWPFAAPLHSGASAQIALADVAGLATCGPYEEAPHSALALPLLLPGQAQAYGVLVAGVSARRALDEAYRDFYDLLRAAVQTAIGNVLAYELEQRRAEELAQIDRAKTTFFSNVSHEFRTPLTLILGPLEDALADSEALAPAMRQRLALTHRNALRLLKLVNSLLDFSRIEAGRTQARFQPLDLAEATRQLAGVFESAMAKGGLAYQVRIDPLAEPVYVDIDMWEKIAFNLLSNAFKFTLQGSVSVTLAPHAQGVRLSVADTGAGIAAHELARVFERFHRIEGTPGRSYEGTGIGLALVQELVRMHGGTISVHSTQGEGTRFDVDLRFGSAHLPREHVLDAAPGQSRAGSGAAYIEEALRWLPQDEAGAAHGAPADPAAAPAYSVVAASRPTVLIADDNADMRAYVAALLADQAQVRTCADGEAAWTLLQDDAPDLLISDVMMPHLDGFGLLARIRASTALRLQPVMLLSARAGDEAKVDALSAGADDYLVKPFSATELKARVARQLEMVREHASMRERTREQERYFRNLIDHSPVMLWTTDADGQCTYLSQRWYDMTGRTPEQDLGLGWLENVHPDDQARTRDTFLQAAAERKAFSLDYRLRNRDGTYRWAIDSGVPRFDSSGTPLGYVGSVIDVHDRQLLRDRFKRVTRAGRIGIWYADAPFDGISLNHYLARQAGLPRHGVTLKQLLARVAPPDRRLLKHAVAQALAGAPLDIELRIAAGGWMRAIGWCQHDAAGKLTRFDGMTLDIGRHKEAEEDLRRLAGQLEEHNRMQSEFMVTLAHELRNPLAPLRSGLDLLRSNPSPARQFQLHAIMARQVNHMVHLVDELLDVARLTQGKLVLKPSLVRLDEVVRDAVDMCLPQVEARQHALTIALPQQPVLMDVDRHRIAQVLSNLINNAAKYTPPAGRINVSAALDGAWVEIQVSDSGVGLPPDMLSSVFELYTQAPAVEGTVAGGIGVGLHLVKQLVALHGGTVAARSEGPGRGSTFSMRLAARQAPLDAPPADLPAPPAPRTQGKRILVVDDNRDAADTLAALLEFDGHTVQVAYTGTAAVSAARDWQPDIMLLDIGLPDQDGYAVAREVRRLDSMARALLIAVSGWGSPQDRQRSRAAGFDHHLTKPLDFATLAALLADDA